VLSKPTDNSIEDNKHTPCCTQGTFGVHSQSQSHSQSQVYAFHSRLSFVRFALLYFSAKRFINVTSINKQAAVEKCTKRREGDGRKGERKRGKADWQHVLCSRCVHRCKFIYFCSFIKYFLMQPTECCQFVQIYRASLAGSGFCPHPSLVSCLHFSSLHLLSSEQSKNCAVDNRHRN